MQTEKGQKVILCPRLNRDRTDWYAQIAGRPGAWAQRRDGCQALGDLVLHHQDEFLIQVEVLGGDFHTRETQAKLTESQPEPSRPATARLPRLPGPPTVPGEYIQVVKTEEGKRRYYRVLQEYDGELYYYNSVKLELFPGGTWYGPIPPLEDD